MNILTLDKSRKRVTDDHGIHRIHKISPYPEY